MKVLYLEGYKYVVQFLLYQLFGENEFNQTHLTKLHLADSWRYFKYIEKEKSEDSVFDCVFNQVFNLNEQTSFDSYFYCIKMEITCPLYNQYKIYFYTIEPYFRLLQSNRYHKQTLFSGHLVMKKNNVLLSWDDQIQISHKNKILFVRLSKKYITLVDSYDK